MVVGVGSVLVLDTLLQSTIFTRQTPRALTSTFVYSLVGITWAYLVLLLSNI
jgi:hypothetical protein